MKPDIDFTVIDYVQRLEMWTVYGRQRELDVAAVMRAARLYASAVLVPVCGYAVQKIGTSGFDPDGFMLRMGAFRIAALKDLERAVVRGWLPPQHGAEVTVTIRSGGSATEGTFPAGTLFSLELEIAIITATEQDFHIQLSSSFQPSSLPDGNTDSRHLGCIIQSVQFM